MQILAEEAVISRRTVPGDTVRVTTATMVREARVDEALTDVGVEIAHVPVGRYVDAVPPVRTQDGVTILPVVEEVLVVERRLLLREEVHLRRISTTRRHVETVELRTQQAVLTRIPAERTAEPERAAGVEGAAGRPLPDDPFPS